MGALTEYRLPTGELEVYASTNRWMRFAIDRLDADYVQFLRDHAAVSQWLNNLLPTDLKAGRADGGLTYLPAEAAMRDWIEVFFGNMSEGGLIPTLARMSGRRYFDAAAGVWAHDAGDTRLEGVLEARYASRIGMIGRMVEFLSWFPEENDFRFNDGTSLRQQCERWAQAFMMENRESQWYGHAISSVSWGLYNFVHTGPPPSAAPDTSDSDMQFRFMFSGFPDSILSYVVEYAGVAQAFELLSLLSGRTQYAEFARRINEGVWKSRLNHSTYLMPDTLTVRGPLPGDQDTDRSPYEYMHSTDCLYWGNGIFNAYRLSGGEIRRDLQPTALANAACSVVGFILGKNARLRCQVRARKRRMESRLSSSGSHLYLRMGLGLTLDWILGGWDVSHKQFVSKIYHSGSAALDSIYGDGKWNTLYMLVEAYRATADMFYLDLLMQAWGTFRSATGAAELGGLFPAQMRHGALDSGGGCTRIGQLRPTDDQGRPAPPAYCYAERQEMFLDVIVSAYRATVATGAPRADILSAAITCAERLKAAYDDGTPEVYLPHGGEVERAYIGLAIAQGTLRRMEGQLSEANVTLVLESSATGVTEIDVPERKVVVYMDDRHYTACLLRRDGTRTTATPVVVAGDGTFRV